MNRSVLLIPAIVFATLLSGCAMPASWRNYTFSGEFESTNKGEVYTTDFLRGEAWDEGQLKDGTYWWMFKLTHTYRDEQRTEPESNYTLGSQLAVIIVSPTDEPVAFDSEKTYSGVSVWCHRRINFGQLIFDEDHDRNSFEARLIGMDWQRPSGNLYYRVEGRKRHAVLDLEGDIHHFGDTGPMSIAGEVRTNTYFGSLRKTRNMKGHTFCHYNTWQQWSWPD